MEWLLIRSVTKNEWHCFSNFIGILPVVWAMQCIVYGFVTNTVPRPLSCVGVFLCSSIISPFLC